MFSLRLSKGLFWLLLKEVRVVVQIAPCKNNAGHKCYERDHKTNGSSNAGLSPTYDIPRNSDAALDGPPHKIEREAN